MFQDQEEKRWLSWFDILISKYWMKYLLTHLPLQKMTTTFTDDILKCIFMDEMFGISILI